MNTKIDAFTQEILNNAFKSIADEMAIIEYRSSFSPVIREEHDFNTALLDSKGDLVSASEQNPSMLGVMQSSLRILIAENGPLKPGDAMIANHPYLGGSHTPDIQIFAPAYLGETLVGYTGAIAHHIDIGGRFVGTEHPETTEIYQEGLIFPGILLVDAGKRNESLFRFIKANVRDPRAMLGDLDAQLAACQMGAVQLAELSQRFGADTVRDAMQNLLDTTAARARIIFESWESDGAAAAEGYLDNGGPHSPEPRRITVATHAHDGTLVMDLTGTDPQMDVGLNVPYASTLAALHYAVREFTDLPMNEGLTRHIEVRAPEGSLLNPIFPAPTVARFMAQQRLASVAVEALGNLRRELAVSASSVCSAAFYLQTTDPRTGRSIIFTDYFGGGGGARPDAPGDHAVDSYTGNCAMVPIEICESEFPWVIERSELAEGSGGEGKYSGGMGLRRDFRLLAERADGICYIDQTAEIGRASGREGGGRGAAASFKIFRANGGGVDVLTGKLSVRLYKGDVLSVTTAGGGGYGSPERETVTEPSPQREDVMV
ncbi:hydantoinase B/oxoprolinase family protein [Salinibacterium sp. ZJ450]|uniref:hydantoinase B/oxoprolinase family protein n=1 Tax=Salinibacterium sp. ZJ450 TaxID=2708338 RepID=UPI0014215FB5|nr:hydantoinase B/oxoprolinase family protein [Salinibacterium sp. ZJ450]